MTYRQLLRIDTPSQRWAKQNGACGSGRCRLGALSIAEYFRTSTHVDDLGWIARRLEITDPNRQEFYRLAVNAANTYGRWGAKHTRARLIGLFALYDVHMPAELM